MRPDFIAAYPTTPNCALAARFGVAMSTILRWARQAHVRKDPAYLSRIQRERASGRVLSRESRARISAKMRGRRLSAETKARIRQTQLRKGSVPRGPRHYNWKGGRPWARFWNPRYQSWRNAILERDRYVCQKCGRRCRKTEHGLAAHHIKPYASHPDLRYEISNGITLCRDCHLILHGRARKVQKHAFCACGCGAVISAIDRYGRPRRFVNGHARRGARVSESTRNRLREQRKGKPLSEEHRAKIRAGLRTSNARVGRPSHVPRGG